MSLSMRHVEGLMELKHLGKPDKTTGKIPETILLLDEEEAVDFFSQRSYIESELAWCKIHNKEATRKRIDQLKEELRKLEARQ